MKIFRLAAAVAVASLFVGPAAAQTVQPRIVVGTTPVAIAANPVTGKVYVANDGSNNVSVIDGATRTVIGTVPVGVRPRWVGINPETNRVLVGNFTSANVSILNGSTDTVILTPGTGGAGWMAIDAIANVSYVIRHGGGDEYNVIQGDTYVGTTATRSYEPVGIAVNPVTNRVYVANRATTDVTATRGLPFTFYSPLYCPDGLGGFKPQPPDPPGADPGACIDIANLPVAVAVNPVTDRTYAISTAAISVILGSNHTFTTLSGAPLNGLANGKAIAVNPVSNKVYAVFANGVAIVNGADNAITTVPAVSGNLVAIGINVVTNKVYVAKDNGTMLVIDGATNVAATITGLTAGSNAIAVDPVANVVYVTDSAGGVTPVTGPVGEATVLTGITTSITPLAGNTSGSGGTINLTSTSTMAPGSLPVRKVYFRIDGGPWMPATSGATAAWSATYAGLSTGSHTIEAFGTNGLDSPSINTDLASAPIVGNVVSYGFTVPAASAPQIGVAPGSLDFGGQSMGTTSPSRTVTITNTGTGTLSVTGIVASTQFSQTNDCSTGLSAGASCTVQVTFTPAAVSAAALNSSTPVTGSLTITSNAPASPSTVTLAGAAEKSLVTHFYRSILRRAPDAGGVTFWQDEAARMVARGASVNEAWYALAITFFGSGEYAAAGRSNDAYVTDLYVTFFNRTPDAAGLGYWSGQLAAGLPREVLLAEFMFSAEFRNFSQAIFGNTQARAEVDVAGDFFRGLLGRLADNGGFDYWVGRFRAAQCQNSGNAVYAEVEAISSAFATSAEYAARARTNAQYVGDLYNAFLRRGGDLGGVQYWIGELNAGRMTREQVRQAFVAAPEFNARVVAVVNQGCPT